MFTRNSQLRRHSVPLFWSVSSKLQPEIPYIKEKKKKKNGE